MLPNNFFITFATTRQWLISESSPVKKQKSSILECHLLSIKLIVYLPIRTDTTQSCFLNVSVCSWRLLDVAKFTVLTSPVPYPITGISNKSNHILCKFSYNYRQWSDRMQTSPVPRFRFDVHFELFMLLQRFYVSPRPSVTFCNMLILLQRGLVSTSPKTQAGGRSTVESPRQVIQYNRSYSPYV